MRSVRLLTAVATICVFAVARSPAQQVTVATPYHALSDSFFENMGTSWGGNFENGFFRVGASPNSAAPQFGGFDPSAGFSTGVGFGGGGFGGSFNMAAAQGSRRTFTSQTPSVTLTDGYPGFISDTSQSPFVMGYIPVVGGFPTLPPPYAVRAYPDVYPPYAMAPAVQPIVPGNPLITAYRQQTAAGNQGSVGNPAPRPAPARPPRPPAGGGLNLVGSAASDTVAASDPAARKLAAARSSSAGRAAPSVAEARRLRQLEQETEQNEALALFEKGQTAEEGGKANVAKIFYGMALPRAQGQLRDRIQARLDAVSRPAGK